MSEQHGISVFFYTERAMSFFFFFFNDGKGKVTKFAPWLVYPYQM